METKGIDGMCRCCASSGIFKDMYATYNWMGEDEIYANMLQYCFDITLSTAEDQNNGGICEVCITQLRNAANFKKQVQQTEVQFKKLLERKEFSPKPVKIEITDMTELMDDAIHSDNEMSDSDAEFSVNIKRESPEPKAKKRAKATSSRADDDTGEPSTKRTRPNKSELKYESLSPEEIKERKVRVDNKSVPKKGIELSKHRMNVREILINSNATPIRCFGGVGYACSFCTDEYPDPADLKNHTITSHKNISKFMKGKDLYRFLVKLDITNLKCKLCKSTIDDLEQLIDHLRSKHNKLIYDIKHQILPFKFDSETLRCFMCSNKFHKFKTLLEHMNVHYRNYICEVCDAGFVTRGIMINHSECHKLGSFACDYCTKVFDTIRKKKSHEKCVHIHSNLLNKCGYCNEKFSDYGKKQKHLKDAHDVPTRELKCEACEKSFVSQKQLSVHIKRVHLIERSHQCTDCDMTFFSSFEMRRHMLKHTGVRDFECSVCHKWYGRRRTLQEHMRIHADDRRFKCEYCGQAFVQKCSLRGHMRAKHGDKD